LIQERNELLKVVKRLDMKIEDLEDESDIADAAAKILRETFIKVSRTEIKPHFD
jgi:hypothetical protein